MCLPVLFDITMMVRLFIMVSDRGVCTNRVPNFTKFMYQNVYQT